tara:strand:- start:404 stop:1414 length:1011 start_codon:yes stop_codon:yes gene_type:complete
MENSSTPKKILKIKKKRGRKPKEKVYGYVNNINNKLFSSNKDENIIIHLPIKTDSTNDKEKSNDYKHENFLPSSVIGQQYEPLPLNKDSSNSAPFNLNFSKRNNNSYNMNGSGYNMNVSGYNLIPSNYTKNNTRKYNSDIKRNILAPFLHSNNNNEWPKKTSIYCFWCCHSFDEQPCGIPIKCVNGVFHVIGCFCSPECCAAYNFNTKHDTEEIWERYSLLHLLYSEIYDVDEIQLAPPKSCLKMFGGPLTIDEFRTYSRDKKSYNLVYPPMIAVIPQLDDEQWNQQTKIQKPNFIPLDNQKVEQAKNNLRLTRNKPLVTKSNTLENCMNLMYKNG